MQDGFRGVEDGGDTALIGPAVPPKGKSTFVVTGNVGPAHLYGSVSVRACSGATCWGCGASRSSSFQDTERDGCPAHMVKAPCSGGNVLAHARSRAEEVPEFVVTAAISSC